MNLNWTKRKRDIFEKHFNPSQVYKFGGSCAYKKLGKSWGVKLYVNLKSRNFSYFNQKYAASFNLAPMVGGRFSCKNKDNLMLNPYWKSLDLDIDMIYGFVTQHAIIRKTSYLKVTKLFEDLMEIGIEAEDLAIDNNIGFVNKKLVSIDFDYWSLGNKHPDETINYE